MNTTTFKGITPAEILILQYCGKAKTRQEIKAVFPGQPRLGGFTYVMTGWIMKGWIKPVSGSDPQTYLVNPKILELDLDPDSFGQFEKDVQEMIDSVKYHIH